MRINLAQNLMSRDGTLAKNALMTNALAEIKGDQAIAFKRPGIDLQIDLNTAIGQGAVCWKNTLYVVSGNVITQGPTSNPWPDGSAWTQVNANAISGALVHPSSGHVVKHPTDGYVYFFNRSGTANYSVKVWRTNDGANWSLFAESQDLRVFGSMGTYVKAAFNASDNNWYIMLGEDITSFNHISRVWKATADSLNNLTLCSSDPFAGSNRSNKFSLICENGVLYMIGGYTNNFAFPDEVWSSTNGSSWTRLTTSAGLVGPTEQHAFKGPDERYYRLGPFTGANTDAVLRSGSADVTTWAQVSTGTTLPSTGLFAAIYVASAGRMYAGGGSAGAIFSSSDLGVTWQQATSNYGGGQYPYWFYEIGGSLYLMDAPSDSVQRIWKATNNINSEATYSPTLNSEQCDFTNNGGAAANEYLFVKTTSRAYVLTFGNPGTLTQVTDVDYPATTVPGAVYLDGYICVMDPDGTIYNSDLENPTSWNSLNFIRAELEPDFGVALAKHQNYLVAFKTRGMEFFYNAANTNGSPFLRLPSAALRIGCAHGRSVASVDGGLFFLSRTSSAAASVHFLPDASLTPQEVATEDVRRVLEQADLTDVSAWAARIGGHSLYALNLKSEGLTLVYDRSSNFWQRFTLRTASAPKSVSALTQANGIATATATGHGFADGDPITIAGASPSGYNGTVNVNVVDANTFTYYVSNALAGTATGTITATGTTEGYFPFSNFVACGGKNFVQHDTQADLYEIGPQYLNDEGAPIDMRIRTAKVDADAIVPKTLAELAIIGEEATGILLARYSDDDYTTFSRYRQINLAQRKPALRGLGRFRRRVFEFRYTGNGLPRVTEAELTLGG